MQGFERLFRVACQHGGQSQRPFGWSLTGHFHHIWIVTRHERLRDPEEEADSVIEKRKHDRLTDWNKECPVVNTTNLILQTVDNDRSQDSLSRSRRTIERQSGVVAFKEARQVWTHPQTSQFFTLVSKVRAVLGEVAQDTVLRCEPGADRFDK